MFDQINSIKIEKDPNICLVYNILDASGKKLENSEITEIETFINKAYPHEIMSRPSDISICADGDSWINLYWPFSKLFNYEKTFFDILQDEYITTDLARPGDTFKKILREREYRDVIKSGTFDFFIFSGGGNDILGGGDLKKLLKQKPKNENSLNPRLYLRMERLSDAIAFLAKGYASICEDVEVLTNGHTRLLVHGYDYPSPEKGGPWLGDPFTTRGYNLEEDNELIQSIIKFLVDSFYRTLHEVSIESKSMFVVNLRDICAGRWTDELHPNASASADIAGKFRYAIASV